MDNLNYKEGDKVICIEDEGSFFLKKGKIYTIKRIYEKLSGEIFVNLKEDSNWFNFYPYRFKKYDTKFRKLFERLKKAEK